MHVIFTFNVYLWAALTWKENFFQTLLTVEYIAKAITVNEWKNTMME